MYLVDTIIIVTLLIICLVMIGGYVIYRLYPDSTERWEDGVKYLFRLFASIGKAIFRFIYQEMEGKDLPEYTVNTALYLTDQEILELVDRLTGHPYDTPVLEGYDMNINAVSWIDVNAVGLAAKYRDIMNEQIAAICHNVIQKYFTETRGKKTPLYIKVATPTRLYVAIPLSENSRKFLDRQGTDLEQPAPSSASDSITEFVPENSHSGDEEQ